MKLKGRNLDINNLEVKANNSISHWVNFTRLLFHHTFSIRTVTATAQCLKLITSHDRYALHTATALWEITPGLSVTRSGRYRFPTTPNKSNRSKQFMNTDVENVLLLFCQRMFILCVWYVPCRTPFFEHLYAPRPPAGSSPCVSSLHSSAMMKSIAGSLTQYPKPNKLIHH